MTDTEQQESPSRTPEEDGGEPDRGKTRRRPLTDEELRELEEIAKPGALYTEAGWRKKAREDLTRIERAIDRLEAPEGSTRAVARKRRAQAGELPGGLRSRITEALGSVAYVQLSYSSREHHVCHVGLRSDDGIEDAIVLVGPEDVRRFEDVRAAIDALEAPEDEVAPQRGPDPFGDVHKVQDVEGIGETFAEQLARLGIEDTVDLWHADAEQVGEALDVSPKTVTLWQRMAELMAINGVGPQYAELLARSGIHSVDELAEAEAEDVVEAIETKQKDLLVRIQGNVIRAERVQGWIDAARAHGTDQDA